MDVPGDMGGYSVVTCNRGWCDTSRNFVVVKIEVTREKEGGGGGGGATGADGGEEVVLLAGGPVRGEMEVDRNEDETRADRNK